MDKSVSCKIGGSQSSLEIASAIRFIFTLFVLCLLGACTDTEEVVTAVPSTLPMPTKTLPAIVTKIPIQNPHPTLTPTQTPEPTVQLFPTNIPAPTSFSTVLPTSTRGPSLAFWYQINGEIHRYNLQTWTSEKVTVSINGAVNEAKISPNGRWFAYLDEQGLKYMPLPHGESILVADISDQIRSDSFVFSPDNQFLAYMDEQGLSIVDLLNDTRSLLWKNDLDGLNQSPPDITLYSPISWSADQEWLAVWIGWWEGGGLALGSLSSNKIFPLSGCSDISWSPNGSTLGMVVRYSSYLLCGGDNDGIYIVETSQDRIEEKLVYQEPHLSPPNGLVGAAFLQWSPDNAQLIFVQEDENKLESRLMLVSSDGTETSQLVHLSNGRLLSPIWGNDNRRIYYIEQVQDTYSVYEFAIDSFEKRLIYSTVSVTQYNPAQFLLLSPDDGWLTMSVLNFDAPTYIYLIHIDSDTVIRITTDTMNGAIGWQNIEEN